MTLTNPNWLGSMNRKLKTTVGFENIYRDVIRENVFSFLFILENGEILELQGDNRSKAVFPLSIEKTSRSVTQILRSAPL